MDKPYITVRKVIVAFIVIFWQIQSTYAFHSGSRRECKECHLDDKGTLRGSDESSACLRCHQAPRGTRQPSGYYVATHPEDMGPGIPPTQLTPGGDFAYLRKTYSWKSSDNHTGTSLGERHGHNIVSKDYGYEPDAQNRYAPGSNYPSDRFSCVSCHDPHGTISSDTSKPSPYRMLGGAGYAPRASQGVAFRIDPPVAVAPRTYNRAEAISVTRVAYGKGMSEWCTNCHYSLGSDAGLAHYGHPSGNSAYFIKEIISNYDAYVKTGDIDGNSDTSYSSLVPFEEGTDDIPTLLQHANNDGSYTKGPDYKSTVMCLTCHRAHASGWDYMTRWNMTAAFIVYKGEYPGIDKSSSIEFAQGRTSVETQKALYDRPVTFFSNFQRGYCNKCHIRD